MLKRIVTAGTAAMAFSNVVHAEPLPDFPDNVTPEAAYSVLEMNGGCLLASDALNPDGLSLTEEQQTISDLAQTVAATDLGRIVTQQNAADNVFYCYWDDPIVGGKYDFDLNAAYITDNTSNHLRTAAEEFVHASQYHTNDYLMNIERLTDYGQYVTLMATEAQAKIWAEKIVYDTGAESDVGEFQSHDIVESASFQCFSDSAGAIDSSCIQGAFESFYQIDNPYSHRHYSMVNEGVLRNPDITDRVEVCGNYFSEAFGFIPDSGDHVAFLQPNTDPADIINFNRDQKPDYDHIKSWQYPIILKLDEGSLAEASGNQFVSNAKYPCLNG